MAGADAETQQDGSRESPQPPSPPSGTTAAQPKGGQTILECDCVLDARTNSPSTMAAPKATFTSDLQIPGLQLRLATAPEVAWPEMKLACRSGNLSIPCGHHSAISASASSPEVQSPEVPSLGSEGGAGHACLQRPWGGSTQEGDQGC
uniref:Uncharacterized protein n=1 Tax=Myotis myotis TaxID=51298 RepID=A0A7J7ZX60_MYOMY|nr:hypothetical protein mMyoMyo1_009590 [Myotis myotis]